MAESSEPDRNRGRFLKATSSYVSISELTSEIFTEEGKATAHEYDPYPNRKIHDPITDFDTVIHLIKGSIGAGILAMPKAFHHSGLIPGTLGTIFVGILCVYAMSTLIKMQYIQCQRLKTPFIIYPMSLRIALKNGPRCLRPLAPIAAVLVDFFLITFQLGICTAYIIFMAESIKDLMEPHFLHDLDLRLYMLALFLPILVINFIRDLKHLSPVSLVADVLIIVAFISCFYYIIFVGPWKHNTTNLVSSVATWPLFVGTVLFAIEAVGVIIAVEHTMVSPGHFLGCKGVFPWSMVVVVSLYTIVGLVGYLKYGKEVKGTIVASLPKDEWLALSIGGVYALCIYGTYPLQMYVAIEIIWGNYVWPCVRDFNNKGCLEYLLRTGVVTFTFVLAIIIPYIDIVISLIGAFSLSCLGISFPFLVEMCTLYPDQLSYFTFFKDFIFIIFGLFILVLGTYVSLLTLINT